MSKMILQEFMYASSAKSAVTLEESEDAFGNKGKSLHMTGIFIQGDVRNANGRIYPSHEIRKAVNAIKSILTNPDGPDLCGHLDHPQDLQISLDRVSHKIVSMDIDGANGVGKLKILPTPLGNIAKAMLESGVKLGVSSRGSGNVDEVTGKVSDFEIVTVDIVAQPSAPNAYPKAIYEGIMNARYGHNVYDMAKESISDPKVNKYLKNELIRIIKEMKIK